MGRTLISVKADTDVKENAQRLAEELGIALSDVLNAALRNFIRTREFRVSSVPQMTPELERLLGKIHTDVDARRNLSPELKTTKELTDYLDAL